MRTRLSKWIHRSEIATPPHKSRSSPVAVLAPVSDGDTLLTPDNRLHRGTLLLLPVLRPAVASTLRDYVVDSATPSPFPVRAPSTSRSRRWTTVEARRGPCALSGICSAWLLSEVGEAKTRAMSRVVWVF